MKIKISDPRNLKIEDIIELYKALDFYQKTGFEKAGHTHSQCGFIKEMNINNMIARI